MENPPKQPVPWLAWLLLLSVLVGFGVSIYRYDIAKNYSLFVEAPCDPLTNECYVRDCDNDGCPPNDLAVYRTFTLPAQEFAHCTDNSCLSICPSEAHSCTEIMCSDQDDVSCEGPGAVSGAE